LHLSSSNLGLSFTSLGAGAVVGAVFIIPWLRARFSPNSVTLAANLLLVLVYVLVALVRQTEVFLVVAALARLLDPSCHEDRETLIYMNHPLRYQGMTFYQSGFDNNDTTTILQVVQNPSWLIPYISCALIAFGMVLQFGMHLTSFARRRVIS
jgi:hypothetical protein